MPETTLLIFAVSVPILISSPTAKPSTLETVSASAFAAASAVKVVCTNPVLIIFAPLRYFSWSSPPVPVGVSTVNVFVDGSAAVIFRFS